jgi:hypothetical protein
MDPAANPVCHPAGLLFDHSTADRRPPTGQIFAGKPPVPMREKASPGAASGRKAEMGWASPIQMGRATTEVARMNNAFCYFFLRINSIHSKSNSKF